MIWEEALALGSPPSISREAFGAMPDGTAVEKVTLGNGGVRLSFITLGGAIVSVLAPDREGVLENVVVGYDALEPYVENAGYVGALVGRYANRIAGGRMTIDGREYSLSTNEGRNHLHGGYRGFSSAVWEVEPFVEGADIGATLKHGSSAGDEGYPGAVAVSVTYRLTAGSDVMVEYLATTDAPTAINMTQHSYWNLAGASSDGDTLGHELALNASGFTPVDAELIPTGEIRSVRGTPFDFIRPKLVGAGLDAKDEQLRLRNCYDHNYVLDREGIQEGGLSLAARLHEPRSGRVLEIHTTEPGVQFYSGRALGGFERGGSGRRYERRGGLALETQHFPDSPNQPHFPSTILRPGEVYSSRTVYRFLVQSPR
jgi:aldose 1-epimerase